MSNRGPNKLAAAAAAGIMATKKDLPMKVDAAYDVLHILQQRHIIPYHSRPFMWVADKYKKNYRNYFLYAFDKDSVKKRYVKNSTLKKKPKIYKD